MPTDVVMPQMGESIFEGTITKWLKKAGEAVQKDEPLFEISTDKVDAEIPSPVTGILQDIRVSEGETVQINTVVAVVAEGAVEGQADRASPATVSPAKDKKARRSQDVSPGEEAPKARSVTPQVSPLAAARVPSQVDVVMPQMGESIFE